MSSIPPSVERLTRSEGRLTFETSFLLAPNVAPPLESRAPPWLVLRGAMRTEVNGLAAFCCRLALVYSRSRSRSVREVSRCAHAGRSWPLTVSLTAVVAVRFGVFIRLLV